MKTILVLNAGSSSIKFSLFRLREREPEPELHGQIEGIYTAPRFLAKRQDETVIADRSLSEGTGRGHDGALDHLIQFLHSQLEGNHVVGVGHRVVHGGIDFAQPVVVNAQVVNALEGLAPLAPLHQPHNLAPIRRLLDQAPEVPQVACFDTSFHRTSPEIAQRFGLPERFHEAGVRRYGFHGLSYEYIASVLEQFDAKAASGRTIVLHLGNGASMCALAAGRSIATTMGLTTLDGLLMGTRPGSLDPGVMLYLMDNCHLDARAIEKLLYDESGLLGVSGLSSDMRTLLASGEHQAKVAIDLFCYRIRRELGSLMAALGGLDAVVFTGGIGENSAVIREQVCRDAAWIGVDLDPAANAAGRNRISTPASQVAAWRIPTNEEMMIARHTFRLLRQESL
jgi:acetate kinase